jgi:hypothetical protein
MRREFRVVLSVLGSLMLFAAWAVQQTILEEKNATLNRIDAARDKYVTYQSNNALFSAVLSASRHADPLSGHRGRDIAATDALGEHIRRIQTYNYELGLEDMEGVLDPAIRRTIPRAYPVGAYFDHSKSISELTERTQDRLGEIQAGIATKVSSVDADKERVRTMFFVLYAVGSVAIVAASLATLRESGRSGKE